MTNMGANCISDTAEEEAKRHKDKKAKKHKKEKKEKKSKRDDKEKELLKAAKKFLKTSALKPCISFEKTPPYSHTIGALISMHHHAYSGICDHGMPMCRAERGGEPATRG